MQKSPNYLYVEHNHTCTSTSNYVPELGRPIIELFPCHALQDASDNGLGSYNNVFNVTKKDFDAYFETWELMSSEKGEEERVVGEGGGGTSLTWTSRCAYDT